MGLKWIHDLELQRVIQAAINAHYTKDHAGMEAQAGLDARIRAIVAELLKADLEVRVQEILKMVETRYNFPLGPIRALKSGRAEAADPEIRDGLEAAIKAGYARDITPCPYCAGAGDKHEGKCGAGEIERTRRERDEARKGMESFRAKFCEVEAERAQAVEKYVEMRAERDAARSELAAANRALDEIASSFYPIGGTLTGVDHYDLIRKTLKRTGRLSGGGREGKSNG